MAINASGFSVTLSGFPELADSLEHLADSETVQEILGSAVVQGGVIVVTDAKRRVPVDTGNLQRSIHLEYATDAGDKQAAVEVGTDVDYGKYVEFGTSRMAAQPYLRPALDENRDEIAAVIIDTFKDLAFEELQNRGPRGGRRSS